MTSRPKTIKIKQLVQIEPGWSACFLLSWDDEKKEGTYGLRPVVCMAHLAVTVHGQFVDQNEYYDSIRPVIARTNGDIVTVDEVSVQFVCLVGPNERAQFVLESVDAAYLHGNWKQANVVVS